MIFMAKRLDFHDSPPAKMRRRDKVGSGEHNGQDLEKSVGDAPLGDKTRGDDTPGDKKLGDKTRAIDRRGRRGGIGRFRQVDARRRISIFAVP
jgi:hypothetical protein